MAIETLDDIVSELADRLGIYGSCNQEGHTPTHCKECTCRAGWESALRDRIESAVDVERKIAAPAPARRFR